jgi:hypothetical protein
MSYKTINLTIPANENIPTEILSFSPEENLKMIKIGCESLLEGRKVAIELSQQEIYNKLKEETKEEVEKMELNILIERELTKKMEERIKNMYESQIEKLEKQIQNMNEKIKSFNTQSVDIINKEIEKNREKYDILLEEKDKQNKLNREVFEKAVQITNMSNSHKGKKGEIKFNDIAETFKDFNQFQIQDKHTQSGEGDFHLHFEDFDILVDAKNYKDKVDKRQRDKIKNDLLKNDHINFAWLVSLNTNIYQFDKVPIMYEWINTKQCIIYINNLLSFENPENILRITWLFTKQIYKLIEIKMDDNNELIELKEKHFKIIDRLKKLKSIIREINTTINIFKTQIENVDFEIKDLLEIETNSIIESNFSLFDNWWNENIEQTTDDSSITSTDIWFKFKNENKDIIKNFDITIDKFKNYIITKIPSTCRILKGNKKGAIEIKGIKIKEQNIIKQIPNLELKNNKVKKIKEQNKINIINQIPNLELKNNKVKKINKKEIQEYFFDNELDNKILDDYNNINYDIFILSEKYDIKIWQVVSLLMRYKVINKRTESRGYEKYKETDEYKEKIIKK